MRTEMKLLVLLTIFFAMVITGCKNSPAVSNSDELDLAIRDASDYLNYNIPEGNMIVILNVQSDSTALSDYIIDELISNAVNDKILKVVDRQQLDLIRTEQKFQLSGEVDDNLAVSIGKFIGAQTIVSGKVNLVGDRYRITIRVLEVQTAQVKGQYNRNLNSSKLLTALMRSGRSSSGGTQAAKATASDITTTSVKIVPTEPLPDGAISVSSVSDWNTAINTIRNGGNNQTYIIHITGNVSVPAPPKDENLFGSVTGITVTIQGSGTLSLSVNGNLLRIAAGQTVVARNVTLRGRSDNNSQLIRIMSGGIFRIEGNASVTGNASRGNGGGIYVNGGTLIMQDKASVTGNSAGGFEIFGGGVYVDGGTFIMQDDSSVTGNVIKSVNMYRGNGGGVAINGGTFIMQDGASVSGNTVNNDSGGGVYISKGTFTMEGGTITSNTTNSSGGGVSVNGGTFTMKNGTISGNTARANGGGVYVGRGTFTKTGGTISGSDTSFGDRNTAQKGGNALYWQSNPERWRNATAGSSDNPSGYGFWLND